MNAVPIEPVRWTRRRWLYAIAIVFLTQVGLILFFGEHPQNAPAPVKFRTAISLAADSWAEQQLADLPGLGDPSLFALPNLRGFSGEAWFSFAPLELHLTDWTEPPRWLNLEVKSLGQSFSKIAANNDTQPLLIVDKPMPPMTGLALLIPTQPMASHSVLLIEGDLARRPLVTNAELPSWPNTDLLTNTVVQTLVDHFGFTLSATVLANSGLKDADQFALKAATEAQFQPMRRVKGAASPETLTSGKLVFVWHTVPLLATNAVAPP